MEDKPQGRGDAPAAWNGAGLKLPTQITLALLDGRRLAGTLTRFAPLSPDLVVELAPSPDWPRARQLILRAEEVAYVGFHPGLIPAPPASPTDERWRVRVAHGEELLVTTTKNAAAHPLAFVAKPVSDPRFELVYFYRHGVSARERDAPLGTLLVKSGVLAQGALEQGVNAQTRGRNVPIGQILLEQKKIDRDTLDEAAELQKRKRLRIGEVLQEAGLVSGADIEAALAEQKKRKGKRIGEVLVELGILKERDLALTLALKFDLPFVNLDEVELNPEAAKVAGSELVARFGVLPVDVDPKTLTVAISDPTSIEAIDTLRVQTQRRIRDVMVMPSQLKRHVGDFLRAEEARAAAASEASLGSILQNISAENVRAEGPEEDELNDASAPRDDEGGIIRLVNQLILDAYRRGASDIHVEPNGKERPVRVRFRVDGDCALYQELPPIVRGALVSRIKILAKLDISERRKPQDGKIRIKLPDRQLELRVATIPTVNGNEDVVMRILAASKPLPLDSIGLSARNLVELKKLAAQPYGLVLCVGPTGSGKTTTLHSILGYINNPDTKIWTAEDPVEITQPGLRQVQVAPKIGFTFAAAMRAFLRADPDVIMVGEMRDQETAQTAIEASLTGHLVMSTLHTNSAPETITRLLDMGLDPFSFGDALLGVLAQRLARGLCKQCRVREPGSADEYHELVRLYGPELFEHDLGIRLGEEFQLFRARGCAACGETGYRGRVALHELLVANESVKHHVAEKAPVEQLRQTAIKAGMRTLLQDGITKVLAGHTDLKQVLSVCSR